MNTNFTELSMVEMGTIEGGLHIKIKLAGQEFEFDGSISGGYNWYKNTYCPDAQRFGETIYDLFH